MNWQEQETLNRIADYLVAAGDYIAEHDWCTKVALDPEGRVCANGAIGRVTPREWRDYVRLALIGYLGIPFKYYCIAINNIPHWNDWTGQTQESVIQAFYDAAAKIRPDAYRLGSY